MNNRSNNNLVRCRSEAVPLPETQPVEIAFARPTEIDGV
jgi:hypothetical protein